MKLHVLTAVTRPQNLASIGQSLFVDTGWHICWHLRLDTHNASVGGQNLKNDMLDGIDDLGWVWILDDDNTAAPGLLEHVCGVVENDANLRAVIVDQWHSQQGRMLKALPDQMVVGSVDAGQAFFRRDAIGELRLPDDYNGDGMFIASVLRTLTPRQVRYANDVVSYHNALR